MRRGRELHTSTPEAAESWAGVTVSDAMTTEGGQMSSHDMRRVAVEAVCHDRSVKRYLDGARVGEHTRLRIEAALRKLGFDRAVRAGAAS